MNAQQWTAAETTAVLDALPDLAGVLCSTHPTEDEQRLAAALFEVHETWERVKP